MNDVSRHFRTVSAVCLAAALTCVSALSAAAQSLIRDTEIEETMHEYTVPILRAAGLNPSSVDIYLVNDGSLNAFVTRGQNIFLHTGLILEAETPNQLKGVIAHETGHIAGGHIVRSDYGSRSAYGAMLIAAGIGIAAILAGEAEAGALVLGGSQQFGALEALAYSRTNESAADQYAAQYMEATGQSGEGLIKFFEKFRVQEVLSNARRYPYFRGHPLSSQRIDSLREVVAESPYEKEADSAEDQKKLDMTHAKLIGFLKGPQIVFSQFPETDTSDEARYARAVAYYKSADLKNAIKEIDALIEKYPSNPYFYELKGQVLYESGRGGEAMAPIRKALELKPEAALFEIALAQALIETDDGPEIDEAIALLKSALRKEPDNGFAWFQLSQAYGRINELPLAKYASAERAFAVGNLNEARSFARRAQEDLPRNQPQWRRASDIIVIADSQLAKSRKDRYKPKP